MLSWKHLIRFRATDGQIYFASVETPNEASRVNGRSVTAFNSYEDFSKGRDPACVTVQQLLAPVPYNGDIICIGLNYREHAKEAKIAVPAHPVMWYKPGRALGGPGSVSIPRAAATGFLDFEGELTIITCKDARDVSLEDAPDYILGYTAGNDLTARMFQNPKSGGGQFTRCKAFDGFAPLGPVLTSAEAFGRVEDARLLLKVNGKVFQDSPCDLIHGPSKLISFLSQGTTIPAGTAIMTGSPPGVGWFQDPQHSLQDGDVIELELTSVGTLRNTMIFDKDLQNY